MGARIVRTRTSILSVPTSTAFNASFTHTNN
nr:MAG TPA: hypothetical protein [Caudoviricetes sp.]